MAQDLRTFLDQVKEAFPQDFVEVTNEVDLHYESTALVEKLEKENRFPVLMFKNFKGHTMPVVINLAASYERLALALGTDEQHMVQRYAELGDKTQPLKWVDRSEAPVKEVIYTEDEVDLSKFPIPVHNELDGGQYISSGVALVKDPETGAVNGGIYRHQVQGRDQLGWFVNPSNHGNYLRLRYEELNQPMDVAIVIGHHPALLLAGVSKMRGIGGELEIMGGLMGEPVEVVRGETVDLPVPARAEIVIEGRIFPGQVRDEGPFGEWPRYYTGSGDRPYIKVSAITMRRDAIYLDIAAACSSRQFAALACCKNPGDHFDDFIRHVIQNAAHRRCFGLGILKSFCHTPEFANFLRRHDFGHCRPDLRVIHLQTKRLAEHLSASSGLAYQVIRNSILKTKSSLASFVLRRPSDKRFCRRTRISGAKD